VWPTDRASAVRAAEELRGRLAGARAVVIACRLGAKGSAVLAPALALAVRPAVRRIAAVGVAPFSFEGPGRAELTETTLRELCALVDVMAVTSREHVRTLVPPETSLEEACAAVDRVAATATEALAWVLARGFGSGAEAGVGSDRAAVALQVGAGEGRDLADAARAAVSGSLLRPEHLGAARGAFLAAATARAPSLGELNEAEDVLAGSLPHGTPITLDFTVDGSLAGRTLAAVCLVPGQSAKARDIFPSEDPETLQIPAFLRRRSAGLTRGGIGGLNVRWKVA
jgi:cell division GTPase FtsZ